MASDTRIARVPSMDELIAVVEMAASGATKYDRLSEVAQRVLEGYPADETEYMGEAIPEIPVGESRDFKGGYITVKRTGPTTFQVTDANGDTDKTCDGVDAAVDAAASIDA